MLLNFSVGFTLHAEHPLTPDQMAQLRILAFHFNNDNYSAIQLLNEIKAFIQSNPGLATLTLDSPPSLRNWLTATNILIKYFHADRVGVNGIYANDRTGNVFKEAFGKAIQALPAAKRFRDDARTILASSTVRNIQSDGVQASPLPKEPRVDSAVVWVVGKVTHQGQDYYFVYPQSLERANFGRYGVQNQLGAAITGGLTTFPALRNFDRYRSTVEPTMIFSGPYVVVFDGRTWVPISDRLYDDAKAVGVAAYQREVANRSFAGVEYEVHTVNVPTDPTSIFSVGTTQIILGVPKHVGRISISQVDLLNSSQIVQVIDRSGAIEVRIAVHDGTRFLPMDPPLFEFIGGLFASSCEPGFTP